MLYGPLSSRLEVPVVEHHKNPEKGQDIFREPFCFPIKVFRHTHFLHTIFDGLDSKHLRSQRQLNYCSTSDVVHVQRLVDCSIVVNTKMNGDPSILKNPKAAFR